MGDLKNPRPLVWKKSTFSKGRSPNPDKGAPQKNGVQSARPIRRKNSVLYLSDLPINYLLMNLEMYFLVRSLKSSNVELG